MSYLLHPPLLDEVGFGCAAQWYVEGFAKRSGIEVKMDIATLTGRLPRRMELVFFRVLQESLTNVHRHSGASDVSVQFRHEVDVVILEVRDFGKGITEERLSLLSGTSAETGVGLAGMRERLHELDGKLEFHSDSSGTRVRAIAPILCNHSGSSFRRVPECRYICTGLIPPFLQNRQELRGNIPAFFGTIEERLGGTAFWPPLAEPASLSDNSLALSRISI